MAANDSKSYPSYLNKLVDEYDHSYHSCGKTPINADYSALSEEIKSYHKAPEIKVGDKVRITKAPKIKVDNRVRFTKYENSVKNNQKRYL